MKYLKTYEEKINKDAEYRILKWMEKKDLRQIDFDSIPNTIKRDVFKEVRDGAGCPFSVKEGEKEFRVISIKVGFRLKNEYPWNPYKILEVEMEEDFKNHHFAVSDNCMKQILDILINLSPQQVSELQEEERMRDEMKKFNM